MNYETLIPDKLKSIVNEAIVDDYDLYEFLGAVNYAIVCAIQDGKIFRNYTCNRHDVEDEFEMWDFLPDDWEKFVKRAYENMGFDYNKEVRR